MKKAKKKNARNVMAWALPLSILLLLPLTATAQQTLSLDSCRAMALRNNKQMSIARVKQDIAANTRKSARTQYLPKVNAIGGYVWTSKEVSILDDEKKTALSNLGTNTAAGLQNSLSALSALGLSLDLTPLASALNQTGAGLVNSLHTDTRNMFAGAVTITQPVFMGGALVALNKMADINEEMSTNSLEMQRQNTLYSIDQAYWQVVSLRHKQKLAENFLELVKQLDVNVKKMIEEGVATRSDGLNVKVKVNEAEMTVTKVNDGVVLSKMLLCQLCGLPVDSQITLVDEEKEELVITNNTPLIDMEMVAANRPELRILQNTIDLSKQQTNVLKAGNLPTVALMGGYAVTNPNTFNGFQRKFAGLWNIGVMIRIPVWNWGDTKYKVRASKGSTTMARLEMEEVREKIELQVNQNYFRLNEANKKLVKAQANIVLAEENLRTANMGFSEGVITTTTVLEAQTAWLQAQSEKIDAEIDVKLSQVELEKALGTLRIEN